MKGSTCAVGLIAALVVALLSTSAVAADSTATERVVPKIAAARINPHPPVIDGDLNDEIWQDPDLDFARSFTQLEPDEGEPATDSTLVTVRYDDEALYVAFWCFDPEPDKIQRQLVRRDRHSESDLVSVKLDPYHDHLTGYQFYVTAAGVLIDSRLYNDDWSDDSWDGVWDGAAKIQPWGWSAEYKIPYHCLRFAEGEEHIWGINFSRMNNRKNEGTWWSPMSNREKGLVSRFGHVTGITAIKPARHLEILPYAVSNSQLTPKSAGNPDGRSLNSNMGVDVKYGLTSNITLDATVNPDFGQVELDQPVLNLSAYETFFNEKRPFFMEGNDLYNTPFMLFYSRRIGRPPLGGIDDDEYDYQVDRPNATSILGAAKMTGKFGSGTSVGVITALTQQEEEQYRTTTGALKRGTIEPTAGYTVMRVKQDIFGNSDVGGMLTITSQDTYHPFVTGGIDYRLLTPGGGWGYNGQTVFSRVDSENIGFGMSGNFNKEAGNHVRGSIGFTIKDPDLYINRLGYTARSDYRQVRGWIQYHTQDDWWIVRNSWNNLNYYNAWNYNGDDIEHGGNFNTYIELINNWTLGGGVEIQAEKYNDLETRGNGLWEWPSNPTFAWWGDISTDRRKKVSFNVNPGSGGDRGGSWWANYVGVHVKPRSNMEFEAGVNYSRGFNKTRWVDNIDGDAIFADLDQNTVSINVTASAMLTRNLSWQISGQGLISTLMYQDYKRYLGHNEYARDVEPLERDGTFSALNSTMLVRWEYLPGSTLYFVWTRSRPEFDDTTTKLRLGDEIDRFLSSGAENIWLVKASYWWNP